MNSKKLFIADAAVNYRTNVRELLKKGKVAAYNNPTPADIYMDKYGKPTSSVTEVEKWRYLYRRHSNAKDAVTEIIAKLYEILWKQCDKNTQNNIKADKKFVKVESGSDIIGLLEIMEMICMSRELINYYPLESALATRKFQIFRQHNGMSIADYYKEFAMLVKIAEMCGTKYTTTARKE